MAKTLIVYYSRKGSNWYENGIKHLEKGNTEIAAELLRKAVGGDIFEIDTVKPYADDYYACCREAEKECRSDARPAIKGFVDSISGYDLIFVCYPCWIETVPMCVFTFLEHYDLTGKLIAPLCTNEGSGMGRSEKDLRRVCAGAQVLPGLAVRGCRAASSGERIAEWAGKYVKQISIKQEAPEMIEKISVNTQSSVHIAAQQSIYFDPLQLPSEPHDADIIFITHEHGDHFSEADVKKAAKADTVYVIPAGMKGTLVKTGAAEDKIVALAAGDKTEVLGVPVEAVAAYNPAKPFHPLANGWLGYIVTLEGKRIYVSGDMDATPEAKAVKCDIAVIPVGGMFTMNPQEAAELINEIKPEYAVPTHYGTIVGKPTDGADFAKLVDGSVKVKLVL